MYKLPGVYVNERQTEGPPPLSPDVDLEEVQPGVVKRVFEAVYARVLAPNSSLLHPDPAHMTERTRSLFDHLFPALHRVPAALEA